METVQKFSDGFLPGVDYSEIRRDDINFDEISSASFANQATSTSWLTDVARDRFEDPARGHQYWTAVEQSRSFRTERSLFLTQLNGSHDFDRFLKGLDISWAMNWAKTKQDEQANGARLFFVPEDIFQPAAPDFPVPAETLGPGQWAIRDDLIDSFTDIEERSRFGRIDGSYELEPLDFLRVRLSAGGWYEKAKRDVESRFLDEPSVGAPFECRESGICQADSTGNFVVLGDTQREAGDNVSQALLPQTEELENLVGGKRGFFGDRDTFVDAERKVWAAAMEGKLTFWERLDLKMAA